MGWSWVRQSRRAHTTRRHPFMLSQRLRLLPVIGLVAVPIGMIGKALGFVRAFGYASSPIVGWPAYHHTIGADEDRSGGIRFTPTCGDVGGLKKPKTKAEKFSRAKRLVDRAAWYEELRFAKRQQLAVGLIMIGLFVGLAYYI